MIPEAPHPISQVAKVFPLRTTVMGCALLVGFGVVWGKLYQLQVQRHDEICSRVEEIHRQQRVLPAHRGEIRDRNGELLAHDRVVSDLYVNTQHLRDATEVRTRLSRVEHVSVLEESRRHKPAEMLEIYRQHLVNLTLPMFVRAGGDPNALNRALTDDRRVEFPLLKGLQDDDAEEWQRLISQNNLLGLSLHSAVRRAYPAEERLTHVLGFVNIDNEGQQGIEAAFNTDLEGKDGMQWIERDRKGREIISRRGETIPARNGHEIRLTIDMELQEIMESTLEEAFEFYHPRKVVAVLVEPRTGAIRAMASRPHFERTDMGGTLSNLAIGSQYEPGSVFKIVTYAGVFDRGLASLEDQVNCDPDQKILAAAGLHDHVSGKVTVAQAFAKSSNRAAYLLATRLGADRYLEYLKAFGFGQQTGIQLTGEAYGTVTPRRNWDALTFSRMAIGHSVTVTPMQMAMAVAAIANQGVLMKPQIVEEVRDDHGKTLRKLTPETVRRVCSARAASTLREAMEGVVSDKGTAAKAAIPGVRVAGKTGTAQLYKEKGKGVDEGHYCVSFAGFAPAEAPQFAAIVIVDDPHASREELTGGVLAGPIFAQLMKQSLEQMAVAKPQPLQPPSLAKGGTP